MESRRISFTILCKEKVRLAEGENANQILLKFEKRSQSISDPENVHMEYQKFAESMLAGYLNAFSGLGRKFWFRAVNKLSGYCFYKWLTKWKYG